MKSIKKMSRLAQLYTRKVLEFADAIITVSDEWSRRLAGIIHFGRILTFKNCINVHIFCPTPPDRPKNIAKALFLGRVGYLKGAFDLLEAIGKLKSRNCLIEAVVAGYEEKKGDMSRAKTRLKEMNLENMYQLVGNVRGAEKTKLLMQSNLFVLPSYYEGLPIY